MGLFLDEIGACDNLNLKTLFESVISILLCQYLALKWVSLQKHKIKCFTLKYVS